MIYYKYYELYIYIYLYVPTYCDEQFRQFLVFEQEKKRTYQQPKRVAQKWNRDKRL